MAISAAANPGVRSFLQKYIMNNLPEILGGLGGGAAGAAVGSQIPGAGRTGTGLGGLVGGLGGAALGGILSSDEARAARERGPVGAFPEFGLSEGLGAVWDAGRKARERGPVGRFPEFGISEMIGKTFGG